MNKKPTEECCYRSVFSETAKRVGRVDYRCAVCGKDVSLLQAFYQMSKDGLVDKE